MTCELCWSAKIYFLGVVWLDGVPERTDLSPLERASMIVSEIEINMKSTAPYAVSLVSRLAAPRGRMPSANLVRRTLRPDRPTCLVATGPRR